ncbi:MAG: endonuclease III domain-containing protein [Candidatus Bilamarchaeum sp.]
MANREFLSNLKGNLAKMNALAILRDAVVFRAEAASSDSPFKVLVFTMLSARTKDETTILALARLFSIATTPNDIALIPMPELEKILYGVGFYRTKARNLIALSKMILQMAQFPTTLEELLTLPGVGRKTANIVLARVYGNNSLGVDTHVHRISNRLGLVKTKFPLKTEAELLKIIPNQYLSSLNRTLVAFGQTVCKPTNPDCRSCPLLQICPKIGVKIKT